MFREACPEQSRRAQFATGRIRRGGHDSAIYEMNSSASQKFRAMPIVQRETRTFHGRRRLAE